MRYLGAAAERKRRPQQEFCSRAGGEAWGDRTHRNRGRGEALEFAFLFPRVGCPEAPQSRDCLLQLGLR